MCCARYLDGFEYMQGLAYRDAMRQISYFEHKFREEEDEYWRNETRLYEYFNALEKTEEQMLEESEIDKKQENCMDRFFLEECNGDCKNCDLG